MLNWELLIPGTYTHYLQARGIRRRRTFIGLGVNAFRGEDQMINQSSWFVKHICSENARFLK